jgi:hypothetical protein
MKMLRDMLNLRAIARIWKGRRCGGRSSGRSLCAVEAKLVMMEGGVKAWVRK